MKTKAERQNAADQLRAWADKIERNEVDGVYFAVTFREGVSETEASVTFSKVRRKKDGKFLGGSVAGDVDHMGWKPFWEWDE